MKHEITALTAIWKHDITYCILHDLMGLKLFDYDLICEMDLIGSLIYQTEEGKIIDFYNNGQDEILIEVYELVFDENQFSVTETKGLKGFLNEAYGKPKTDYQAMKISDACACLHINCGYNIDVYNLGRNTLYHMMKDFGYEYDRKSKTWVWQWEQKIRFAIMENEG